MTPGSRATASQTGDPERQSGLQAAGSRLRVGLLATHPVQYYTPWYQGLTRHLDLEVFYCHRMTPEDQGKAGFAVPFDWDVPLLEGYNHRFLHNVARRPGIDHFFGCNTPEIGSIVRRSRFDAFILHGWAFKSCWQAMTACWRMRTPLLVRGESHLSTPRSRLLLAMKRVVYPFFVRRFDAYLLIGEKARRYLLYYGADPERMFPASHAVDNDFFSSRADAFREKRGEIRRQWGIPESGAVFLFAGKLLPSKRPEDLARAVAMASRRQPHIWALMVGDGPLRGELESLSRREGWPIRFAGFLNQSEMPKGYAAGDALVLPSDGRETWGLVANEAMACGLPAIVSDQVGCAQDLVRPGETGFVFRCGDVEELASLLVRLAADPQQLAELGRRARAWVDRYSIERAIEGTVRAVQAVAKHRDELVVARSPRRA